MKNKSKRPAPRPPDNPSPQPQAVPRRRWWSESRAAFVMSVLALAAAGWQAYEARQANVMSMEALLIEAEPTNVSRERIARAECSTLEIAKFTGNRTVSVLLDLRWRVTIFNASSLPVTIKSFKATGETPGGRGINMTMGSDGSSDWPRPVVLPAKEWAAYFVDAPSTPSEEFAEWFAGNGGCDGRIDWKDRDTRRAARFYDGGWRQPNANKLVVTVTTGAGSEFTSRSTWHDSPYAFTKFPDLTPEELAAPAAAPTVRPVPRQ
jgi:hypothetical protein